MNRYEYTLHNACDARQIDRADVTMAYDVEQSALCLEHRATGKQAYVRELHDIIPAVERISQ